MNDRGLSNRERHDMTTYERNCTIESVFIRFDGDAVVNVRIGKDSDGPGTYEPLAITVSKDRALFIMEVLKEFGDGGAVMTLSLNRVRGR